MAKVKVAGAVSTKMLAKHEDETVDAQIRAAFKAGWITKEQANAMAKWEAEKVQEHLDKIEVVQKKAATKSGKAKAAVLDSQNDNPDSIISIEPNSIGIDKEARGRRFLPSKERIQELAISLHDEGQLVPCEGRRDDNGKVQLSYGYTRHEAAKLLRKGFTVGEGKEAKTYHNPDFTLRVQLVESDAKGAFIRNVIENAVRNETSPIDNAFNCERLRKDFNLKNAAIARLFGYSNQNKIDRLEKLLQLDETGQKFVHEGALSVDAALLLVDIEEEDRKQFYNLIKHNSNFGARDIREWLREKEAADESEGDDSEEEGGEGPGEGGSGEGSGSKARSLAEIREFIRDREAADNEGVAELCRSMMKFMAGKLSEKGFDKVLNRVCGS